MEGGGGSGGGRRSSGWEREEQFRGLLHKAAKKASRELMDTIADIAIRDDKVAYKAVCALLLHEMKALKPSYRLKLFFVASAILRQSKSRRGDRDKYAARFEPLLEPMADLLAPLGAEHLSSVLKVLDVWWRDEIFPPATVAALQTRFKALLDAAQPGGSGGAASSGGGGTGVASGAVAQPAHGVAQGSVTGAAPPPPPPQLSSMSPGSLSGGAHVALGFAAAATSSLGQAPAAAGAAAMSQVSKAAGGTPVVPGIGDSLSSHPAAAAGDKGLRTVGSSSQLLQRQQSTEAYDPFAALGGAGGAPPPPPPPERSPAVLPPLPPMPGVHAAAPAGPAAWQQQQQQAAVAGYQQHAAAPAGPYPYPSHQQLPGAAQQLPPAPPPLQQLVAAPWQQQSLQQAHAAPSRPFLPSGLPPAPPQQMAQAGAGAPPPLAPQQSAAAPPQPAPLAAVPGSLPGMEEEDMPMSPVAPQPDEVQGLSAGADAAAPPPPPPPPAASFAAPSQQLAVPPPPQAQAGVAAGQAAHHAGIGAPQQTIANGAAAQPLSADAAGRKRKSRWTDE